MRAKYLDELTEDDIKQLLFEVYSAGFESGYSQEIDLVKAYNQYWNGLLRDIKLQVPNQNFKV